MTALPTDPAEPVTDSGAVHLVDTPSQRVRRFTDLLHLGSTLIGITLILLIGVFASGTTEGITSDVRSIWDVLRGFLLAPVNILEGIVTFIVPAIVIVSLALRREPRRIVESLAALAGGIVMAISGTEMVRLWGSADLISSLSVTSDGIVAVTMPAYLAGLAAMLTAAGRRGAQRPVSVSWNIIWIAAAIAAISGLVTLPAVLVTVLAGRATGLALRYAFGSASDRAYGAALMDAISRAGFTTARLIRIDTHDDFDDDEVDQVGAAMSRTRQGRIYALTTAENHQYIVVALDGDQRVADTLAKVWRAIRLRGLTARPDVSLRHLAESTALVSHAARTAGVRTPRVMGMAHARDTMVLVYQRPNDVRAFADLGPDGVSDDLMDSIWSEVLTAHASGIAHRSLTSDTVLVGTDDLTGAPDVWLTSWEMGEVATGQLSRRMDAVQLIAMFAAKVGAKRAVASAFRRLSKSQVSALAPLLQAIMLPRATRVEIKAKGKGKVLQEVRDEILEFLPEAPSEPANITRFGLRTVITITLGIAAALIVLLSLKPDEVLMALREAEIGWVAVALGFALLTFVGAAITMVAFAPIKLPWGRVLLAQVAAAYVALAAPAGIGPAAINLRLLTRRKVPNGLAVATVALVQVSAIFVTVLGLLILSLVTGSGDTLVKLPSERVLVGIGVSAVLVALTLTVPKVRAWAAAKILPTFRQTWPRLVQILGQPWRILLGIAGNLLLTAAYVAAFYSALRAFGLELPLITITVVFLLGNAAGAIVPTPGGLGTVEVALTTALTTTAGVATAVAGSSVVLFRAVTYWARIPLGYLAMRFLQKKGEL